MPLQRPPQLAWPYLNPNSPLYQGLVFAGLGPHPGGWDYHDCSPYRNNGRLTNMDPATDWVWEPELGRWGLAGNNAVREHLLLSDFAAGVTELALSGWVYITNTKADNDLWVRGFHNVNEPLVIWYDNATPDAWQFLVTNTGGTYSGVKKSSGAAIANAWCHFYWDFMPEVARLFINGTQDASSPFALTGVDDISSIGEGRTFRFGDNGTDTEQTFVGRYSDLITWNRRRTLPEIQALADPSNAMLSVGNTPLILPRRRLYPAAAVGGILVHPGWSGNMKEMTGGFNG